MRDRTVFTGDPTIYMRDRTVFTGDPTKGRPAMAMRLPIARGEFLLEAIEVATACEQHHERLAGLPGMGNAAERIHDLVTRVRAIAAPRERKANCDAAKRARSFLKAAGAVLEVGGDVERVRRLRRDHPLRNATPTKLALAVEAYELLLRERALLEEARASVAELAMELRSTPTRAREKREARMRATKERDAVLSELREVIGVVRVIARGVFADDPQTVRKFTSASGRKRRRAQRAAHNVMVPVVVAST